MSVEKPRALTVFAPAKINLYLHVTDKRQSGYHELDSLISFADVGDEIRIESANTFQFEINGPFAGALKGKDASAEPDSSNLAVKAVWALSHLLGKAASLKLTLTKNLPLGAGIGGGSADAAATLWGLLEFWDQSKNIEGLDALMLKLGADVPVCFSCTGRRVEGIGEVISDAPALPEMPIVLIYPGKPCHTGKIFDYVGTPYTLPAALPKSFEALDSVVRFLQDTQNDLTAVALKVVPEIHNVLSALKRQDGCLLSRMSGSGSSCFGLFTDEATAQTAASALAQENPDWWVQCSWLGRCGRY